MGWVAQLQMETCRELWEKIAPSLPEEEQGLLVTWTLQKGPAGKPQRQPNFSLKLHRLRNNTPSPRKWHFSLLLPFWACLWGPTRMVQDGDKRWLAWASPHLLHSIAWHQLGLWHEVPPAGLRSGRRQCPVLGTDRRAEMLKLSCAYCIIRA